MEALTYFKVTESTPMLKLKGAHSHTTSLDLRVVKAEEKENKMAYLLKKNISLPS